MMYTLIKLLSLGRNFEKNRARQKSYHSLKEHPIYLGLVAKYCKIRKI